MVSKVIEVTDLTKHYRRFGREKTAVDRLTFSVAAGSVVGFLGRNGAGKNTTILAMLDLISNDIGDVGSDFAQCGRDPVVWSAPHLASYSDYQKSRAK